ncbi:response regulator transcription factor [Evansella sp. AB-P1]|uniref:response regulator transcription factor n=1 Tax=Evansella sp. AB-P1 TaxID=3037653 RepID=UPI00241F0A69|nr:response regulator transcription factor [Evansella sp. AB-P1]MDG5786165.1 response regulator transcription factor [Evansella sp. AB-P1]
MLKVIIADDHPVIRDGFSIILSTEKEIEVVGTAQNGNEAISLVMKYKPDIVLMDLYMPEKNGLEALKEIKYAKEETKVLILSSMVDEDVVIDCLSNGASGVLLKDWGTDKIIHALKASAAGQLIIPESFSSKLIGKWINQQTSPVNDIRKMVEKLEISLSNREEEVLIKVMEGKKNGDIAQELFLSVGTIKNYTSSIYKKIGVTNRDELIEVVGNNDN